MKSTIRATLLHPAFLREAGIKPAEAQTFMQMSGKNVSVSSLATLLMSGTAVAAEKKSAKKKTKIATKKKAVRKSAKKKNDEDDDDDDDDDLDDDDDRPLFTARLDALEAEYGIEAVHDEPATNDAHLTRFCALADVDKPSTTREESSAGLVARDDVDVKLAAAVQTLAGDNHHASKMLARAQQKMMRLKKESA